MILTGSIYEYKCFNIAKYGKSTPVINKCLCTYLKSHCKGPCICSDLVEVSKKQQSSSLLNFINFGDNFACSKKTTLRRLLLQQQGTEKFLLREQINEVVEHYLDKFCEKEDKEVGCFTPMHQIFICHCGWLLHNPTTLPCGHTMCKHCADKNMFCYTCGATLTIPSNPNLFLVRIIETWFPKEYLGSKHKKCAEELYDKKDYIDALEKINLAIELMHDDYTAYDIRAQVYVGLKEYKLALEDANKSFELNKDCGKSQFTRGICYSHLGNLSGAIDAFQLCLELEPENMTLSNDVINKLDEILSSAYTREGSMSDSTKPGSCFETDEEKENNLLIKPSEVESEINLNELESTQQNTAPSIPKAAQPTSTTTEKIEKPKSPVPVNLEMIKEDLPCSSKEIINEKVHGVPAELLKREDFECRLCYEILHKPLTTSCGHVFCKDCLLKALDRNQTCPVCRLSLSTFMQNPLKPITTVIVKILELFFKEDFSRREKKYSDRMEKLSRVGVDEDVEIPIFVCSIVFPYVRCPLHIFEPKYRLMVRECLESGSQKFGMCSPQSVGTDDYSDMGTICELEKVQSLPDGRYIISAVAGQRFFVQEKISIDSMNYAKVEFCQDEPTELINEQLLVTSRQIYCHLSQYINSLKTAEQDCIFNVLGSLPEYDEDLQQYRHGVPWVWWGLAALPLNATAKLALLRSVNITDRMKSLERFLRFLTRMQVPHSQSYSGQQLSQQS